MSIFEEQAALEQVALEQTALEQTALGKDVAMPLIRKRQQEGGGGRALLSGRALYG